MDKLTKIHREVLKKPDLILVPELTARDVDSWDSLAHLTLILAIEKEYRVRFEPEEIASIGKIRRYGTNPSRQGMCRLAEQGFVIFRV